MAEYPNDIHPDYDLATAYKSGSDDPYDYIGNYESAISYANDGYRIVVHRGDGHRTKDQVQSAVDDELAAAVDCFGQDHRR